MAIDMFVPLQAVAQLMDLNARCGQLIFELQDPL
jgi:hypothetical protein